jgi:hypothetical protein
MSWAVFSTILAARLLSGPAHAESAESPVTCGKYLASFSGCDHGNAAGNFLRKPGVRQEFSCSGIGFKVGEPGIFVGPNPSSDKEIGLGGWTDEQIATALTTGRWPDGGIPRPIMPWRSFAELTEADVAALVAYLRRLPPAKNRVTGLFGPHEKPPIYVMQLAPPVLAPRPPRNDNSYVREVTDG